MLTITNVFHKRVDHTSKWINLITILVILQYIYLQPLYMHKRELRIDFYTFGQDLAVCKSELHKLRRGGARVLGKLSSAGG
jgi:hypothetical protein